MFEAEEREAKIHIAGKSPYTAGSPCPNGRRNRVDDATAPPGGAERGNERKMEIRAVDYKNSGRAAAQHGIDHLPPETEQTRYRRKHLADTHQMERAGIPKDFHACGGAPLSCHTEDSLSIPTCTQYSDDRGSVAVAGYLSAADKDPPGHWLRAQGRRPPERGTEAPGIPKTAIPSISARFLNVSGSRSSVRPASTARQVKPAERIASSVGTPTTGTS